MANSASLTDDRFVRAHLGSRRQLHDGQKIHPSLMLSNNRDNISKARPQDSYDQLWADLRNSDSEKLVQWKANVLDEFVRTHFTNFIEENRSNVWGTLRQIAMSSMSAVTQSVIDSSMT